MYSGATPEQHDMHFYPQEEGILVSLPQSQLQGAKYGLLADAVSVWFLGMPREHITTSVYYDPLA